MDLQKVKKAIEQGTQYYVWYQQTIQHPVDTMIFDEAIAELEKPADEDLSDAVIVAKTIAMKKYPDFDDDARLIQQYAESFAARKCVHVRLETLEEVRKLFFDTPVHKYTMHIGRLIDAAKKEAGE